MFPTRYVQRPKEELRWLMAALIVALLAIILLSQAAGNVTPQPPGVPQTVSVISPWYGVFCAGDYPGAPPYVHVGEKVTAGTIVGRIETICRGGPGEGFTIPAGVAGTVVEILVIDGEQVAVGQELLRIQVEEEVSPPICPLK